MNGMTSRNLLHKKDLCNFARWCLANGIETREGRGDYQVLQDKVYTTLAKIRAHSPCEDGWKKLYKNLGGLKAYGEDTPLTFRQIYDSNGYEDTLWCLRTTDEKYWPLWRHFAADCAASVPQTDQRCIDAIEVAHRYADGLATEEERSAAESAARAAAWLAAWSAAWLAAWLAARSAQMELLFEYCRTGKRVFKKEKAALPNPMS